MQLRDFSLGRLRVFAEAECFLGPGLNWFVGPNGAGKTTLLEAVSLLGLGRSFRTGNLDAVLQAGAEAWWVRGSVVGSEGQVRSLAVGRGGRTAVERRLDGRATARASELASALPLLVFEPQGSELVFGSSERRRRLLDWGVFHVEHGDIGLWSRYQRALRQRNLALKAGDSASAFAWEGPLAEAGMAIAELRAQFLSRWHASVTLAVSEMAGDVPGLRVDLSTGWSAAMPQLSDALVAGRARDLGLGYTYAGPHRADLVLKHDGIEVRDTISRGQARSIALALVLAMAASFRAARGESPVLLLDDVCAELDGLHLSALLRGISDRGAQALISSVALPAAHAAAEDRVFHVEQGKVTPLLYSRA
ncbi:MAG: DNA replication and repair protein RecF [Aquimonas sp.]|nr:DNA replication and repair protein RecF [Aquimonas sp.]